MPTDKKTSTEQYEKPSYDENIHKKNRHQKHTKRRSMKKKSKMMYEHLCQEYDNFMIANQVKKKKHRESPHIMIHRSLRNIQDNTIFLKTASVENEGTLHRKIHYEIDSIGQGVVVKSKFNGQYMNVHLQRCWENKNFIVVPTKSVYNLPGVVLFSEDGKLIVNHTEKSLHRSYVLLAVAEKVQKSRHFGIFINKDEIDLCEKFWNNQIKTDGSFHFGTTGKIFSLGYGPKYQIINDTMSVGEFAEKKQKYTENQVVLRDQLKTKMFNFLHCSVNHIFSNFDNLQKTISPHVAKVQTHFDLCDENNADEFQLQQMGILNVHICHNAQTKKKHTECDSSYTIISVPDQEKKSNKIGNYNMANFELNLNEHKALVVPLEFNTILIYSGFLLTHRQQIFKLNENVDPFINVVSYNSQKLFKHLMESFRREINETSKRK